MTYVLYPDEGHGFARPENRLSFYAVTEAFLAKHSGGRYEPVGKTSRARRSRPGRRRRGPRHRRGPPDRSPANAEEAGDPPKRRTGRFELFVKSVF